MDSRQLLAACLFLLCGSIAGCADSASRGPSPLDISSAETSASEKVRAVRAAWRLVDEGATSAEAMRETLKKAAWKRSLHWEVRTEAVLALIEDEAKLDDTRNMLRLMLPTETHWQMIELISRLAGERGWTDLTTALVRSWSRPVVQPADDDRPERHALMALHPDREVVEVVFEVFAGRFGSGGTEVLRPRDRKDAWELLLRIDPEGVRTAALLSQADSSEDPIFESLRTAAQDLGVVPRTREQLEWVERLRSNAHAEDWSRLTGIVASLGAEQRDGLRLRHLPALLWVSTHRTEWLTWSREQMVSEVMQHQRDARLYARLDTKGVIGVGGESIRGRRGSIQWGDALLAKLAIEVVRRSEMSSILFVQAEGDKRDTSTELGGLVRSRGDRFIAEPHHPRPSQRMGDRRFSAPASMIEASTTALFHYHFHANRYSNADFAGPSPDDLTYADRFGAACLVLTFVSADLLNADLYLPGRVVLDLGVIRSGGAE